MKKTINWKLNVELAILQKIIEKWGYEGLLDFLECIDADGDINPLEKTKKILRDFHNNKSKLFIINRQ